MLDDWQALCDIIRARSRPLEPLPVGIDPDERPLEGIRAVLFDVYGTLFISESGDVGTSRKLARPEAFVESLSSCGIQAETSAAGLGESGLEFWFEEIALRHREARSDLG